MQISHNCSAFKMHTTRSAFEACSLYHCRWEKWFIFSFIWMTNIILVHLGAFRGHQQELELYPSLCSSVILRKTDYTFNHWYEVGLLRILLLVIYGFDGRVSGGQSLHIHVELHWSSLLSVLTHTQNLHHFLCNRREENENKLILLNAA